MITLRWFNKSWRTMGSSDVMPNWYIKDGFVYSDNLSEELDSATIVLITGVKIDFEPFDVVEVTMPILGTKTMVINDLVENQLNIDGNLYEYTINLASKTKELERVVLPNMSITKPKGNSAKTVYQVCSNIVDDYSPAMVFSEDGTVGGADLERKYSMYHQSEMDEYCPDMQMTKPTLRSAIDRVLSVINGICYLTPTNEIKYLDLNKKGDEIILDSYYNYKPENQSGNDYATETENNFNNVVPNEIPNVIEDTSVTECIGFRSDSMLINDDNAVLITQYPIYHLKHLYFCQFIKSYNGIAVGYPGATWDGSETLIDGIEYTRYIRPVEGYFELDIAEYVKESEEYNILSFNELFHNAFYTRGSNKIEGLLKLNKVPGWPLNYVVLEKILSQVVYDHPEQFRCDAILDQAEQIILNHSNITQVDRSKIYFVPHKAYGDVVLDTDIPYQDNMMRELAMFRIIYESQPESVRMQSGKYLPERNQNNVIVDNPSEAYVDIKRQGELFNQKCNRLGNRVKEIHARFPLDYEDLPELGDYIGDFVLMHREFSFYDDFILFKGVLTENFVNINYFTGINARRRTWNIVSAGEAFDKQLLDKWFCELSVVPPIQIPITGANLKGIAISILDALYHVVSFPALRVFFSNEYTQASDVNNRPNAAWIECDLNKYIVGNSIVFNFGMYDNYSVGISVDDTFEQDFEEQGGTVEKYNRYTNMVGETSVFKYWLIDYTYTPDYFSFPELGENNNNNEDRARLLWNFSDFKPRIWMSNVSGVMNNYGLYYNILTNHKDSREKIGINIQFEVCSATPDLIVGEAFLEHCSLLRYNVDITRHCFLSNQTYKINDKKYKAISSDTQVSATISISNYGSYNAKATILCLDSGLSSAKSFVICDADNRLILAINRPITNFSHGICTIYLGMHRTRDHNIYTNYAQKQWIAYDDEPE